MKNTEPAAQLMLFGLLLTALILANFIASRI